jgi:uncharacterized membrane protein YcaP (DUF421 family)
MKKEEIHFGDLGRWLLGNTTPEFMLEVAIRTALIYLILLLTVHLMGKRMTSQMTITELSVMITLGAIVSPATQLPDRGLLFGAMGLLVAVLYQRGVNLWAFKNLRVEELTQGKMVLFIKDGIIMRDELKKNNITHQQLFALLRENDIYNLGKVKRGYMEACGVFSVFEEKVSKPGLSVFPPDDSIVTEAQEEADHHLMACKTCGNVQASPTEETKCTICDYSTWITAYTQK